MRIEIERLDDGSARVVFLLYGGRQVPIELSYDERTGELCVTLERDEDSKILYHGDISKHRERR